MKALLLLLASLYCFGGMPAGAQEEENQGIKVYGRGGVIYKSNLDGSGEQRLTEGHEPDLSPDQRHVAYYRNRSLYLFDIETMEEKILVEIDTGRSAASPVWHPRGSTIFFNRAGVFLYDIYAVEKDGTNHRLVVDGGGLYDFLSWPGPFSPDGGHLLYTNCHDDCESLRVVDLDTGNRTELSGRTSYGAWAPNGRHIAFGDARGPGLFVADPGGAQVQTVLEDVQVGDLSWSPDSARIAYTQLGGVESPGVRGEDAVYEVGLDGTGKRSREAHFDKWEHALDSTTVVGDQPSAKTWGQVKKDQR